MANITIDHSSRATWRSPRFVRLLLALHPAGPRRSEVGDARLLADVGLKPPRSDMERWAAARIQFYR